MSAKHKPQTSAKAGAKYDAIVLGSDPNALTCATYLAKAGRSTLILEAREQIGGLAVTEEFAPHCRASATLATVETFSPEIIQDLKLAKHGLRFTTTGSLFVPRLDGRALFLEPPGRRRKKRLLTESSPIHGQDFTAYTGFDTLLRRLVDAFAGLFTQPLPDLGGAGMSNTLDLLRRGWRLRRLGAHDLAEAMRILPMPIADVLDERFKTSALKAAVALDGLKGAWLGTRSPGSTLNLLLHRFGRCRSALNYPEFIIGGTGGLVEALLKTARGAGATVRVEAPIARIAVKDGKVRGVVLKDGQQLRAKTVFSSLDPRTTLLEHIDPMGLDPAFRQQVEKIRGRGTTSIVKFVLGRLPQFRGAPNDPRYLAGRIQIGADLETLEKAFDNVKYGRLPERPVLEITLPSIADPDLAPKDKVILHARVLHTPYRLRQSDWDAEKVNLARLIERRIAEFDPNFPTYVEDIHVLTPLDLERRFGLNQGCLYQVEPALDQLLYMRPVPGWGQYKTPIDGLYLCGSGSHGGGPLTGLPGRNAVLQALKNA